jgi:hypothetical protein
MSAAQSKDDGGTGKIGLGGPTSGEAGATLNHETMAETGGSGGPPLTKPRDEEIGKPVPSSESLKNQGDAMQGAVDVAAPPEGAGSAATAVVRGAQDTRSDQAGIDATGLGTPETGGNQSEEDLPPPRRP